LPAPKKYINNSDLFPAVVNAKKEGVMTDELARMLQLITLRYSRSGKFIGYTFNEDMQAFAMMTLVKTWDRFDPDKYSNAFAYYTTCIHNSFLQFLNKEKTQREVRDELLLKQGLTPSFTYTIQHADDEYKGNK